MKTVITQIPTEIRHLLNIYNYNIIYIFVGFLCDYSLLFYFEYKTNWHALAPEVRAQKKLLRMYALLSSSQSI